MQRPGPVDPPAPEGVIVMAVELATDVVRNKLGLSPACPRPWHVPAHYPVFAEALLASTSPEWPHCRVTVDITGAIDTTALRLVGVTLDTVELDAESPLFSVAVAGAVTVVAPCDDGALAYAVPGEELYWSAAADKVGYTTAPEGLNTFTMMSTRGKLSEHVQQWLAGNTDSLSAAGEAEVRQVLASGHKRRLGMLLGKGSEQQNECRVLLSLW